MKHQLPSLRESCVLARLHPQKLANIVVMRGILHHIQELGMRSEAMLSTRCDRSSPPTSAPSCRSFRPPCKRSVERSVRAWRLRLKSPGRRETNVRILVETSGLTSQRIRQRNSSSPCGSRTSHTGEATIAASAYASTKSHQESPISAPSSRTIRLAAFSTCSISPRR